ncbi:MAG: hypothetical protein ACRYG8_37115 [Janthinobacterium lividum]
MSRRRSPLTPLQIEVICTLHPAGGSWRAIGRRIGRPHVGCRRWWVRQGVCPVGSLP